MPDKVLGERACCFVTVTQPQNITLKEICVFLDSKRISKNKWPEKLKIIKEMPLTPTKKIIKNKLLEKL
jgi:non-ribosomal peptide synthetase component E (peptide arylation enzyme)